MIQDLGSTNGTSVNGRRIHGPTPLDDGAVIFLGSQVLVFRLYTPAEMAAVSEDAAEPFDAGRHAVAGAGAHRRQAAAAGPSRLGDLAGRRDRRRQGGVRRRGPRAVGRAGKLVAINCAAIPRELVESELFGYEKGAHSTAQGRKIGLVEAADGGTLFLDEIGEMPLELQSKLLRFLQDRRFSPLGSTRVWRPTSASSPPPAGSRCERGRARAGGAARAPGRAADPAAAAARADRGPGAPVRLLPARRDRRARVRARGVQGAHAARLAAQRARAAEGDGRGRGAEPQRPRDRVRAPAEHDRRQDPVRDPRRAGGHHRRSGAAALGGRRAARRAAWCASRSVPRRRPRVRRPAPTGEELVTALGRCNGNVAQVARHLERQYAVVWRIIQRYGIDAGSFRRKTGAADGRRDGRCSARGARGRSGSGTPGSTRTRVDRVEGDAGARRRRVARRPRRPLHRPRLLQPALADPGAALHARRRAGRRRLLPRAHRPRPRCAARLGLPVRARPTLSPGQQRGGRPAGAGGRRLRRRGGRADHHARRSPQREAEIFDALEAELGVQDDLRDRRRPSLRRAGGVRRRLARRARRVARRRSAALEDGIAWRSSRSPGRRPACSSTSARRACASARWRAGARVLDLLRLRGRLRAAAPRAAARRR